MARAGGRGGKLHATLNLVISNQDRLWTKSQYDIIHLRRHNLSLTASLLTVLSPSLPITIKC